MISLRPICGNIEAICSISAGFAARGSARGVETDGLPKKKYRIVRAVKATKRRSDDIEIVCCWSDIVEGICGGSG